MKEEYKMINKQIKVEYLINRDTKKVGFTLNEIAEAGQNGWEVDYLEKTETFTKFTNNGKVSKSELSEYDIVNQKAEEMLEKQLRVESECKKDMARAIELKTIVNEAVVDANNEIKWVTIKEKTSHSNWYQHGGSLNMPSRYLTQVPESVKNEALELQAIRRKHSNDAKFDFDKTAYNFRKIRIADHDNGR